MNAADTAPELPETRLLGPVTMPVEYENWWETNRARFIRSRIERLVQPGDVIVDVGCGRGTMLDTDVLDGTHRVNVDGHIWDGWSNDDSMSFVCASANALPFRDDAFAVVGSFDMLEHLDDDTDGLREQRRVCQPGGHVVSAVPADERLWSLHDDAVGHQRRYTPESYSAVASDAGLVVDWNSHFYSFLWVPARLARRSEKRKSEPANDAGLLSRSVRRVIGVLSAAERWLVERRPMGFGTSLWFESKAD